MNITLVEGDLLNVTLTYTEVFVPDYTIEIFFTLIITLSILSGFILDFFFSHSSSEEATEK